ncbi:MAG: HlyC/CorC family transporter [Alphaproteobacteria bacterium]|nr:HlyC/CorC family transporter [Alphaproteobacteria bacterium]
MTLDLTLSLLAIAALLAMSAFFSASETALTAVSKARMHHLANEGSAAAKQVNRLIGERERMIGAVLLGNTFINIFASALATSVAISIFPEDGVVIATIGMTITILIFSEVLPKTLAIARTDRIALGVAYPLRLAIVLLGPVVGAVQFVVWRLLKLFGLRESVGEPVLTAHEEIRGAIDLHHQEGTVEREHRDMLGGILDLAELRVADIMIHRKNMEVIDGGDPVEEIVERIIASSHTRFPVYRDDPENIVGVLNAKDLLRTLIQQRGSLKNIDIMALATQPWFVPDTTTLQEQLDAFRERRGHFALVVDEYGVLQGLVTLEDILEEIFGGLAEEHKQSSSSDGIRKQADGSYNIDGWISIRDLNRELEWSLPDEEATTIAGLVIHEARVIPEVGHVFSFYGFKFEVLRRQRNQIMALRITPPRQMDEDRSG